MRDSRVLRKNENFVSRRVGRETVLLPVYRTSASLNCIYSLNAPAAWLWDRVDGKTTLGEFRAQAAREFDSTPAEIEAAMDTLAGELLEIKALK